MRRRGSAAAPARDLRQPLALRLEDCKAVIEAADRAGVHLIVGHTHGFDANVREVARLVQTGDLGRLGMMLSFNYTDFLYRARRPEELDTSRGGGIVFNQVMHQIEIVHLIGGRLVRSERASLTPLSSIRRDQAKAIASPSSNSTAAPPHVSSTAHMIISTATSSTVGSPIAGSTNRATSTAPAGAPYCRPASRSRPAQELGYGRRQLPSEQQHLPHFGSLIIHL